MTAAIVTEPDNADLAFPALATALPERFRQPVPTAGPDEAGAESFLQNSEPGWTERDHVLPESPAERIARAVPENTRRSYASHRQGFTTWYATVGRVERPATAAIGELFSP